MFFQRFVEFDLKYFGTSLCIGDMVMFCQSGVHDMLLVLTVSCFKLKYRDNVTLISRLIVT